jgi:hypothetical protein
VTTRDRIVITVVAAAALLAGYWFLILAPKRNEAQSLNSQVSSAKQRRDAAVADANASRAAKAQYAVNYATVARLGKAVPSGDDMPSLVYQLASTSRAAHVDFREIKLTTSGTPTTPPAPPSGSGSSGSTGSNGSSGSKGSSPSGGSKGSSGSSGSSGAAGSSSAPATSAAAAQVTTAGLPPGASVGPAGLPTMPFSFNFEGSFFHLSDFFGSLDGLVGIGKVSVDVRGRLLMVDGIALSASPQGFPHMKAQVAATAFLVPADQGTTNGATPSGPASSASAKSVSSSGSGSSTPPTAAAGGTP